MVASLPALVEYLVLAVLGLVSVAATYMAIVEKNLVRAAVYSAIQSIAYGLAYVILMAPDIALVYIPVSAGLYPAVVIFVARKVGVKEE